MQTITTMRDAYVAGARVAQIYRDSGVTKDQLYYWLDGGPLQDGRPMLTPLPRRARRGANSVDARAVRRAAMIARLWRAADAQARKVEERIGTEQKLSEGDSRALAVLVKTLRELSAFDAKPGNTPAETNDEFPRDVDDLRRELARKIDAIIAARGEAACSDGDACSGEPPGAVVGPVAPRTSETASGGE
jgi:hypothetical protein